MDAAVAVVRRFVVAESSMAPALRPGDGLLAVPLRRPRVGRVVVARHPHHRALWLVKRVAAVGPATATVDGRSWTVDEGEVFLLSDDDSGARGDSRAFGPVPMAGAYRVVARIPGRWLGRPTADGPSGSARSGG